MDTKLEAVINEIKEITKKDCYIMKRVFEPALIIDSKIGGYPYLPEGEEIPKTTKGEYMAMLVQINFTGINLENYPNKGIFQLFVDKNVDWPTEFKIKYYEDISKPSQTNYPNIGSLDYFFIQNELKIAFEKSKTYITVNDFRFNNLFCKLVKKHYGLEINNWMDLEDVTDVDLDDIFTAFVTDKGNIGGYADFTQSDPRESNLSEDYTQCFIKIDSELDPSIVIGDTGIAWLLMKKEDVINKNFTNASFDWDCY